MNAVDLDEMLAQAARMRGQGDPVNAERMLAQVLRRAPECWDALLTLGDALCMQGRFRDALNHWQQLLERYPAAREIYERIALAFDGLGCETEASEVRQMAAKVPMVAGVNDGCVSEAPQAAAGPQDDLRAKEARIVELEDKVRAGQHAIRQSVETLREMQDALGALDRIAEVLGDEPLSHSLLLKLGEIYHAEEDDSHAIEFFSRAASLEPLSGDPLNNLGAVAFASGAYAEAETFFYQALEREPGHREARENLRRLYAARPTLAKRDFAGGVECPCCGGSFPKFIHGGVTLRPDALCPACHSLERHRLQWLYFRERTNIFRDPLRVLHFAPEARLQEALKAMPNLDYTSADLYSPLAMEKVDIADIPYEDGAFDVVLCSHVLEHIPDDRGAMAELHRVLKAGGWAILQVPLDLDLEHTREDSSITDPGERTRLFGQHDHVRMYGRDYADRLTAAGFEVNIDTYVRQLGSDAIRRYGLVGSEDVYYCTKGVSPVAASSSIEPSQALPLPPPGLRFMNESDQEFLEIGEQNLSLLQEAGFGQDSSLLDIGSGYGRLAHAIARTMPFRGRYLGMDILAPHIHWCQENITRRVPNLRFSHVDIRNGRYNPRGIVEGKRFRFDHDDRSFDFCALFSVFTHMYEADIHNYLCEIARLLKASGRCVATFFLYDDQRLSNVTSQRCNLPMHHVLNEHTRYYNVEDPLHAIAYHRDYVEEIVESCGLNVLGWRYGNWGGDGGSTYQDVMILGRP